MAVELRTASPCSACGAAPDERSRECVICGLPMCTRCKKTKMLKLEARTWVCPRHTCSSCGAAPARRSRDCCVCSKPFCRACKRVHMHKLAKKTWACPHHATDAWSQMCAAQKLSSPVKLAAHRSERQQDETGSAAQQARPCSPHASDADAAAQAQGPQHSRGAEGKHKVAALRPAAAAQTNGTAHATSAGQTASAAPRSRASVEGGQRGRRAARRTQVFCDGACTRPDSTHRTPNPSGAAAAQRCTPKPREPSAPFRFPGRRAPVPDSMMVARFVASRRYDQVQRRRARRRRHPIRARPHLRRLSGVPVGALTRPAGACACACARVCMRVCCGECA